jgi:hypothetical protein
LIARSALKIRRTLARVRSFVVPSIAVPALVFVAAILAMPPTLRGAEPRAASAIWTEPGDLPIPAQAESIEITREDEALFIAPSGGKRGVVSSGVRLPIFGALRGAGCVGRWLLVAPLAWVCSDHVQYSALPPGLPDRRPREDTEAFPYRYFYVATEGAQAWSKPADSEDGSPVEELERGWAVATTGETTWNGRTFLRTKKGRFIERSELAPIATFSFHGEELHGEPGVPPNVAWVFPDKANVFASATPGAKITGVRTRLQRVDVLATKKVGRDSYARISGDDAHGEWMRASDLRAPTPATLPEGLRPGERWIDVELATQTLTAYEGDRPVFATVVSTGRVAGTTPKGAFRIWVKLRTATMANADDPGVEADAPLYSIEDVPWVQYFSNGVALHAAFWHRRFGEPHSHGCVNLAPIDALWLFHFTTPRLPAGWDAAFPSAFADSTDRSDACG